MNVTVLQPLSVAASFLQHVLAPHQCTLWIKFLTSKLANSKFYYCWQLKQLRANKTIFHILCLFWCGWSFVRIQKGSILHGKVASIIRWGGLSVFQQLHILLLTLPTKNYKRVFEFVEAFVQNIVSFFTSNTVKMAFSTTS